jgi:hypothetical protein
LGDGFEFYIHIDKKSSLDLALLKNIKKVHLFKEYTVNWGSINHLKSILFLADKALKNKKIIFSI